MLSIKNLNKTFGKFQALNNVNLEIDKGEIFGFIGPNGAGKSTTMKIISGLLTADSGEVIVDNIDALKNNRKVKEKIGYMPDYIGTYDNLTALEFLDFYASIYGILGKTAKKRAFELLELVNLKDKANSYVEELSRGMKQRLSLARALMHDPKLLILDEPASGMDPKSRFEMRGILKSLGDMDKTVIVSSHILSELGETCSKLGIINKGTMVVQGTLQDIMNSTGNSNAIIISLIDNFDKAVNVIKEYTKNNNVILEGNEVTVNIKDTDEEAYKLLKYLINKDIKVSSYTRKEGNLEELFMEITKGEEK